MYSYPYQINSAFSKNPKKGITTTLGIEAHLALEEGDVKASQECTENPFEYHAGYSRFTVVLIRKEEGKGKTIVTANIPAKDDADRIIARTKACENILAMAEYNKPAAVAETTSDEVAKTSPAYTVTMTTGSMKGKTPAQVLIEDPANRKKLIEQYKFLQEKITQYPKNQLQLDAIKDAVKLFDAGNLNASAAGETESSGERSITVYEAKFKPLRSTLDDKGTVLVYSVTIRCTPGRNYPYEFIVKNSRCSWDGQVAHPQTGDPYDEVTIYLPEDKWVGIVSDMERQLSAFTTYNYGKQSKKAEEANRINRVKTCEEKNCTA